MTSSLHAAIFLGKGYSENLHSIRNTGQKPTVQKLFDATQTLIREQEFGDLGSVRIKLDSSKWEELHLASDKEVIQLMKAKVYVFSDSVLCVGKMSEYPQSNTEWENRFSWFKSTPQYKVLDGPDVNQWSWSGEYSQDTTMLHILREIQKLMGEWDCTPEEFRGSIFLCRCSTTFLGKIKETNSLAWKFNQR